jgi:type IV pilus assembly protein PilB
MASSTSPSAACRRTAASSSSSAAGKEMDFRVSRAADAVRREDRLRLLDKSNLQLDMTKLGFEQKPLEDFKDAIHRPTAWCW